MPFAFQIGGVKEFAAAVQTIKKLPDDATRKAVKDAAEIVRAAAAANAPRRTGRLAASIAVTGPTRAGTNGWTAQIGPTAPYGRRIEIGYHGRVVRRRRGGVTRYVHTRRDRSGRGYNQAGKPYFAPVFNTLAPTVLESVAFQAWAAALGGALVNL